MKKRVNIMIGRFQPFTKGHYKCIEEAWKKKRVPTIICMINTDDTKVDKKHPFPSSMLLPLYKEFFKNDRKIIDIVLVKNADIVSIGELLHNQYNIVSWTCGTDRIDSYRRMSEKYHDQAHLSDSFEMIEVKRSDEDVSATKVRQALLDDNKKLFYKLTPLVSLNTFLNIDPFDVLRRQILRVYDN